MEKKVSKYEMVKQDIQHKIEQSELKPNQILPSESELCEQYQVSRITVRKAVDDLVHEGRLYRMKGKGCFVLDHAVEGLSPIYSFTEAIIHEGKEPSKQLISMVQKKAGGGLGQKMGIQEDDEVYEMTSLYFADKQPYCLSTSILPAAMFPKLEYFDFDHKSLYEVLKNFYQLGFSKVRQTIIATEGTEDINAYLGVKQGKPLLKINATSFCLHENKEKIFEVYESYVLTDILSYSVEKYNM